MRFKNELYAIRKAGGKVIRLTKTTEQSLANKHISNCDLDESDFDAVINNNEHTSMEETFVELIKILVEFGWFKVVNQ